MTSLTASIPFSELDKLDQLNPVEQAIKLEQTTPTAPKQETSFTARILEAYEVAHAYVQQIKEPDFRQNVESKLVRSNVRGSQVVGVRGPEDVVAMLANATGWREVVANLKDKQIAVLQGELTEEYAAFAAYASVREIFTEFGSPGLGSIQPKAGYQVDDDFYFCTMLRFPTTIITVQLKTDGGVEHLHQWFAGPELSSRMKMNDGDTIVRCGVVIPRERDKKNGNRNGFRQNGRSHRAG